MPAHVVTASDSVGEELQPLEQMAEDETRSWIWGHIHIRCASVYLLAQWLAFDESIVTNSIIEAGERHVEIAARLQARNTHVDDETALDYARNRANTLANLYAAIAETAIEAGVNAVDEPLIKSDLQFCKALSSRTTAN